jgi:hypothetical protein
VRRLGRFVRDVRRTARRRTGLSWSTGHPSCPTPTGG